MLPSPKSEYVFAMSLVEQNFREAVSYGLAAADVFPAVINGIIISYAITTELDLRMHRRYSNHHEYRRFIDNKVSLVMHIFNNFDYRMRECQSCKFKKPHLDFCIEFYIGKKLVGFDIAPVEIRRILAALYDPRSLSVNLITQEIECALMQSSISIPKIESEINDIVSQFIESIHWG